MYARMWGGLLQDTVSPLGDMVHFIFKPSDVANIIDFDNFIKMDAFGDDL